MNLEELKNLESFICPFCKGDLDYTDSDDAESENWVCVDCGKEFTCQVERIRRDWETRK